MKRSILTVVCCVLSLYILRSQDVHFSQFDNTPLHMSPAQAGVFGGDMRFVFVMRDQWRNVPVPYTSVSISAENKFYHDKGSNRYNKFFTGGLLINYDQQGSLRLTTLQVGIPISYTAPLAKGHYLTFGVNPMFGQRSFDTAKLTTDSQWNESVFDPAADTREGQLFANTNLKYFDLNAGLNYRLQSLKKRSKIDVGLAMHHVNRPDHDFWSTNDDVHLQSRISLYGIAWYQIASRWDLAGQAIYQWQGGYREAVVGAGARFFLNPTRYDELSVQLTMNYRTRFNDALIPHFEVFWRTWALGFSWDFNVSAARNITNFRGGPEFSLIYRFYKVKIHPFKSCPII